MKNEEIIKRIFKEEVKPRSYYEEKYPERDLKEGARVSRYAPSPTGFIHMGALYASFVSKKIAEDTNGIFYLRIEDTDQKRQVENGIEGIIQDLNNFKIIFDEGVMSGNRESGNYGPYIQSERREIYHSYIKDLLENGKAYVSFATPEELDEIRSLQEKTKDRIGYYGAYATDRNLSEEEVISRLDKGEPFVIRLKSTGDFFKKFTCNDLVKGKVEMPENDIDHVIMKKDGLPTYHFAHIIDDHLMHTTHVVRGDEWFSSLPIHHELWKTLGFKEPKYAHISPLMKEEDGVKRKLSKRKDPEAAVSFYEEEGIPPEAVMLYLMTIANSNFEEFLLQNKGKGIADFTFDFKKMSKSGALFDLEKLNNISRNYLSTLKATDIYEALLTYTEGHDKDFYALIQTYKDDTIAVLNIEREQKKPRKDFYAYSDIKNQIWYMYDELFTPETYEFDKINDKEEIVSMLETYINEYYNEADDEQTWFSRLKDVAEHFGYAREVKEYKNNPENYKGHVGDISMVLRVALTSKAMTPNLYDIVQILGKDRILKRIEILKQK
ncbi:MAG: glutamate--tRNA ligase [Bacilli bacterium]|nr:glutamate--tRNA ligase [Bacilli bacterium]